MMCNSRAILSFLLCALLLGLSGCASREEKEAVKKVETLMEVKEYSKALEVLNQALEQNKKSKRLLRARILLFLQAERIDLALAAYKDFTENVSKDDDILEDALKHKDPIVRANAARLLSQLGDPDSIKRLLHLLDDKEDNVRRAAVYALGDLKNPKAVPGLIKALKDSWWWVRQEAALALGKIKDASAIAPLFEVMKDEDKSVRAAAADSLLNLVKVDQALYVPQLQSQNVEAARVAAFALASVQNKAATPYLAKFIDAPEANRRALAVNFLRRSQDPAAVPSLKKALKDSEVAVRGEAVLALGEFGDPSVVADLKEVAMRPGEDSRVKQAALYSIDKINNR
jgi:HEAT repeat protein